MMTGVMHGEKKWKISEFSLNKNFMRALIIDNCKIKWSF
jgi:hypothetical protein